MQPFLRDQPVTGGYPVIAVLEPESLDVAGQLPPGACVRFHVVSAHATSTPQPAYPTKEVRFSTYGVPMIAGEVRRYLRDNAAIRVSRSIRDIAYRVLQCKEAMTLSLGREPTLEEISKELSLPQEDVSEALDAVCAPLSLYDPVYTDGGDPLTVMDQVRDNKNTELNWMEHIALKEAFRCLGKREQQILSLRFYDGKTQMEVAKLVGISQAQVSRLEKNAIGAMRKKITVS